MKVYVLTLEPYHENSVLIGVFSTLEAAQSHELGPSEQGAPEPGPWRPGGVWVGGEPLHREWTAGNPMERWATYQITEMPLDGVPET